MKATVSVKDFSLTLGHKEIVRNLSFNVHPGEVFALLGANGSGKTSTIRALIGLESGFRDELPGRIMYILILEWLLFRHCVECHIKTPFRP